MFCAYRFVFEHTESELYDNSLLLVDFSQSIVLVEYPGRKENSLYIHSEGKSKKSLLKFPIRVIF